MNKCKKCKIKKFRFKKYICDFCLEQHSFPKFQKFNKIPRLSREIIITEKIDGSNGLIYIDKNYNIFVGSRNRWLWNSTQKEIHNDNHGFAQWVKDHKRDLLGLGKGYHYGEWMGQGINRNYGLKEKRFYLFDVNKWTERKSILLEKDKDRLQYCPDCCYVVPILDKGILDTNTICTILKTLKALGSVAVRGFMNLEGIVIYHTASKQLFKKTIKNDEHWKNRKDK